MGLHDATGFIFIRRDNDAFRRAQVQVPEHVAGRERGHEHVFRVVAARVAQVGGVCGAPDGWLACAVDIVIAHVGPVGGRARAPVARPGDARGISVFAGHFILLACAVSRRCGLIPQKEQRRHASPLTGKARTFPRQSAIPLLSIGIDPPISGKTVDISP